MAQQSETTGINRNRRAGAVGGFVAGVAMGLMLHGALGLMPTIGR